MKTVTISGYYEDNLADDGIERWDSPAYLIAEDIAAVPANHTLDFFYVKTSDDGNCENLGFICDISVPICTLEDIADLPAETITFVRWMASKHRIPLAIAV